nr:PREDICTED: RNA-directed DNA polymerase from mobile element jockey-like [Megachile rotundata]
MRPSGPILQSNLNRSARAQDLFGQALAEREVGLGVVAEPYRVPVHPSWIGDSLGSVAIVWTGRPASPPCSLIESGRGFVAADWGGTVVVGVYAPPSWPLASFEVLLDEVRRCVLRCLPCPVIVLGDFNSKATAWGSPRTDPRGETLLDWAAGLELRLLNTGSVHTCVRQHGGSIVDLSFATPAAARRISGWRVVAEVETLSDHRYITMVLSATPPDATPRGRPQEGITPPPRWSLKKLNKDALMAAAHVVAWHSAY